MSDSAVIYPTPLNVLLRSAEVMLKHNEFDAAEVLLQVIVKRNPQYKQARDLLDSIKAIPVERYYVDYDYHTGMFEVLDKNDNRVKVFLTREEAERFAKTRG